MRPLSAGLVARFPKAGSSPSGPACVLVKRWRTATLSPSQTTSSIVSCASGKVGGNASLTDNPYLEREDIMQALRYVAWRAEEREVILSAQSLPRSMVKSRASCEGTRALGAFKWRASDHPNEYCRPIG